MSSRKVLAAAATILVTSAACAPETSSSQASGKETLTVFGAASTRVLNADLPQSANVDTHLAFINGGSGSLLQQLEDGAPGDVLITADRATMDEAVERGVVSNPAKVATNSMVLIVPKGNPAHVTGADASLSTAKVVTCDHKVPCGKVAEELISSLGLDFTPVSRENSVSDVAGKVLSGVADAGWVYRTDAQALVDSVDVFDIPGADSHANEIMAAVVKNSDTKESALALVKYLASAESAQLWSRHGFTPATEATEDSATQ
ncbi:molybdate ABC transporter substrate-binding protein [Corynebacterium amycolatum]|uniref:molybdate ABC transporter substrate-binding protein n=1 Tax=Corynebacterium TaxID=1716 RepID=UPI0008A454FB|nr:MULTISPECIES: molybdate ABC transporter substrate-binding protein [Corynebacterium]MCG7245174.1 molybdate ABC transporter substrate-binding protein [Corynebacterium sp. ACRPX]MCT1718955.1 molybdate ABC transporter substrate-binding protein [Corynebacterium amycolatum]